jgi:hypothetical protein
LVDSNNIKDTANAVKEIVKAIPVYQDVVQPAAKEIGKGFETLAKTIHIALAPISTLVWGYDQIKDFVLTRVSEKLKNIPPEQIITPSPHIVAPTLEALRYTAQEETLRELYANLLATSLDSKTAQKAHPGFVDIIKNLSPDEARILRLFSTRNNFPLIDLQRHHQDGMGYITLFSNFSLIGKEAGCDHLSLVPNDLDNLNRLGLTEIPAGVQFTTPSYYEPLEKHEKILKIINEYKDSKEFNVKCSQKIITLTNFGKQFCSSCVIEKTANSQS